jgi:hypothetical protein
MAVRHGYGKIAGANALVFAYDTGDTRNSYKGEPTTNLVTNPTFLGIPNTQTSAIADNWYFSGDTSATGFRFYDSATAPIPLKFPNEGAVITTGPNGTTNRRIYYNGTVEPNTTYTLSYWLYSSAFGSISNYFFTYKADGTGTTSPSYGQGFTTGQWVFIQQSFTTPADTGNTRNVNWGPVISAGTNSLFAMQRFQIEAKSHATQFVNGTRSATQGLLDLTGNYSLDLSNVSFSSTAQVTFDGSNDYIDILNSTSLFSGTQDLTVEAAYNMQGQGGGEIFGNYGSGYTTNHLWFSGQYGIWLDGGVYAPGYPLANGKYHMVGTRENGVMKLYLNGVLVNSGTRSNSIATDINYRIGADVNGAGEPFTGDIYVVKAYSRALTADEVRNNYNHYKTRFNLP